MQESCKEEAHLGVLPDVKCVWANLEQPLFKGLIGSCSRDPEGYHCHHSRAAKRVACICLTEVRSSLAPGSSGMLPIKP